MNNVNNKVLVIALSAMGALLAISLVMRFFLMSEYGFSGGWMFLGLPFGGIGIVVLLLRLGILGSAQRTGMTTMVPWQQSFGTPPPAATPSAPASAQRLQELDGLLRSGAISDTEYSAKRQQILSTM